MYFKCSEKQGHKAKFLELVQEPQQGKKKPKNPFYKNEISVEINYGKFFKLPLQITSFWWQKEMATWSVFFWLDILCRFKERMT